MTNLRANTKRRTAAALAIVGAATIGGIVASSGGASAAQLYESWCEGGNLHILGSNGGTGVIYDSSQC